MPRKSSTNERKFPYDPVYKLLVAKVGKEKISDKEAGQIIGVSERQVRNARLLGMPWEQADTFCLATGNLPFEVYGDAWFDPQAYFEADLKEGRVTKEEIPKLFSSGLWRD